MRRRTPPAQAPTFTTSGVSHLLRNAAAPETEQQASQRLSFQQAAAGRRRPPQLLRGGGGSHVTAPSGRRLPGRLQALAAISSGFWGIGGGGGRRREECIRKTFNRIDRGSKGHITESDLQAFAESHGLPRSYVRPFLDAVLQHEQELLGGSPGGGPGGELEGEVGFDAFQRFVSSREQGLREAFDTFDLDGDGLISPSDLHASLARISICCQPSRCVLRTRAEVVAELLGRLNIDDSRLLSFAEFRQFFMLLPQQSQMVEYWVAGPESCELGLGFSLVERGRRRGSPWGHLLAGAVAGAASRSLTAPLETLRLAAMAGTLPPGVSMLDAGRQLVRSGGVAALYKGNLVNVLRSAPARAVDFFAFDMFKGWLGADTYAKTFAAAGLAGTCSWALLYPLEVVRSRLTLDVSRQYSGLAHCVAAMAREGPAAFYRGLGPSLAAIAPEAAITYGLHDLLKRGYQAATHQEPSISASLWCGVFAAWSGQLVAFPLEVVSRRSMVWSRSHAAAGAAAPSMAQVLAGLLKEGGPAALYRGLGAATLKLVPSAAVSFGAYELMRKLLIDAEARQAQAQARARHAQLQRVLSNAQRCNQHIQALQSLGVPPAQLPPGCPPCGESGEQQAPQAQCIGGGCGGGGGGGGDGGGDGGGCAASSGVTGACDVQQPLEPLAGAPLPPAPVSCARGCPVAAASDTEGQVAAPPPLPPPLPPAAAEAPGPPVDLPGGPGNPHT